jgi:hypothetical protein
MNHTDKLANALEAVLDNDQQIEVAQAHLLELETKSENVLAEAIRVIKSSGKEQVLFRGTIFKLGTDPAEDSGHNDTLDVSPFDGVIIGEDGTSQT